MPSPLLLPLLCSHLCFANALLSIGKMLELAKQGARWLRDYEGWGVGPSATVVEEEQEPPEMLRHLEHKRSDAREVCRV